MKKYILYCLITILCAGCRKNDDLSPSYLDVNWFILEDSSDPIDHMRYELYKKYDVPIYYNDTIGSMERMGVKGIYETYYERLQVFFSPGTVKPSEVTHNFKCVLKEDKAKLKPVIEFVGNEILPVIHKKFYIQSIFLAEELNSLSGIYAYKGLNTLAIGQALKFSSMTNEEKKMFKGAIIRGLIGADIVVRNSEWLEDNFYDLTYKVNPLRNKQCYSTTRNLSLSRLYQGMIPTVAYKDMRLGHFGFLVGKGYYDPGEYEQYAAVPDKTLDVNSYIEALFAYTPAELEAKYGIYPVIMAKFEVMKKLLKNNGFEF